MAIEKPGEITDEVLWKGFQRGDRQAYELILKRYYAVLYRYCSRFSRNRALVEDCVQDVFVYIWEHRESLSHPPSVKFYLLKAVRHRMFLDLKESSRWVENSMEVSTEEDIEKHLIREETYHLNRNRLSILMNSLPSRQREALFLRYFEGMAPEEIVEIMGVNRQSVANFLYRALTSLRENWTEKAFNLIYWTTFFTGMLGG